MHDNPFASGAAEPPLARAGALYSETAVLATTFFATPLGASVLMGLNAQRAGVGVFGPVGSSWGLFAAAVAVGLLPIPIPGVALTIAQLFGMRTLYRTWFEQPWAAQQAAGEAPAPWTHAALICLVGLSLQIAFVGLLIASVGLDGLAE